MENKRQTRPVWAEINLDNLSHNIKEIRKRVGDKTLVMAVIKANAYGHGSIEAAKVFLENGANRLAVSLLSEGVELRKANIDSPIMLLNYTPEYQLDQVLEYDLIQSIYTYEDAKALSDKAISFKKTAVIHIKVDTGMGRIGFLPNKESIEDIIKICSLPNIKVEGIFTHFSTADEIDKSYTKSQFEKFAWVVEELKDNKVEIPIKHVSNSAAIIDLPEYNLDMVRPGIMLYGYYPSEEVKKSEITLKPAMTLKANISNIKHVAKETGISYGKIFVTNKESIIGTLPIGYADGYSRMLTEKGVVTVNGKRVPIVGKICMDQMMIDLTDVDNVKIGDEVVLFGYGLDTYLSVEELSKSLGTVNYELVCMVGRRVPRVYIRNGKITREIDYLVD